MKWILLFTVMFLSIVGISEILHSLKMLIMRPKKPNNVHICFLNDIDGVLNLIHSAEQMRWNGSNFASKIIAVDFTDNAENKEAYNLVSKKYNVEIIKPDEFNILNYGDINGTNYYKGNG